MGGRFRSRPVEISLGSEASSSEAQRMKSARQSVACLEDLNSCAMLFFCTREFVWFNRALNGTLPVAAAAAVVENDSEEETLAVCCTNICNFVSSASFLATSRREKQCQ